MLCEEPDQLVCEVLLDLVGRGLLDVFREGLAESVTKDLEVAGHLRFEQLAGVDDAALQLLDATAAILCGSY